MAYLFNNDKSKVNMTSATVTIAVADWSEGVCTKNCTGVTASNTVILSPAPASVEAYTAAQVNCTAQGAGTLTFGCEETPTEAITVNVVVVEL